MAPVLAVIGISKTCPHFTNPRERLRSALRGRPVTECLTAIQAVWFEVGPGEAFADIGQNGAGGVDHDLGKGQQHRPY